jgi:hypothetical protein
MDSINEEVGENQLSPLSGQVLDSVINYLDRTPIVKVKLEIIPPDAQKFAHLTVLDETGAQGPQVPFPINPHPYDCTWPAGVYAISAVISPPDPRYIDVQGKMRPVQPPFFPGKLKVTP